MNLTSLPCILENMEKSIAQRLVQRRQELGLSQTDVASRMDITPQSVQQWEAGRTTPRGKRMTALSNILQCSPEWLQFGIGTPGSSQPNTGTSNVASVYFKEARKFPVISWVTAGDWAEAIDMFQPGVAEQWESSDCNVGDNAFWLRVIGDSMTAPSGVSIPEGHLILVDPAASADNGSLVVAKLVDSDEVTFKKLVIDAGQKYLKPLNPNYRTIEINGNCRIVGVVKEAKIKL